MVDAFISNFFRLVEKLCLASSTPDETKFIRRSDQVATDLEFSWHMNGFPAVHSLAPNFKFKSTGNRRMVSSKAYVEENLSHLVDILVNALCRAVDRNHMVSGKL